MPGLTVTEKEHWKERISRRIDKKVEALAAEQPNLVERVQREARAKALESLGLAELQAEDDRLANEKKKIDKRKEAIQREMLAKIRGVPVADLDNEHVYSAEREITPAIQRRQKVHEDELYAQDPLGQKILEMRREKEELLDTVWLASSPKQIKELWTKVAELLGDEQTRLQKDALAIQPVEE
jgi:hypothetical protein